MENTQLQLSAGFISINIAISLICGVLLLLRHRQEADARKVLIAICLINCVIDILSAYWSFFTGPGYSISYSLLILYATLHELSPHERDTPKITDTDNEERIKEIPSHEPEQKISNPLWLRIEKAMVESELWRNPDLTASMMTNKMHTNRTSFSNAIRDGGYDNFYDYLAHYRIDAFCKKAESEYIVNIQDAFFEVGYKARTTAFSQFKKIKGMSPSEYVKLKSPKL